MAIVVYCPSCQSKIRAPENVMGRQVKCPGCHQQFAVGAAPTPAPNDYAMPATAADAYDQFDAPAADALPPVAAAPPRPTRGSNAFLDYLLFRRMIAPIFIQIFFWLGVITIVAAAGVTVVIGVIQLLNSQPAGLLSILIALVTIIVGPLSLRILCELMILFFRMNEALSEIRANTERPPL